MLSSALTINAATLFKIVYRLAGERRRRALESRSRIAMLPAELLRQVFERVIKDTWTFKAPAWLPYEARDEESRFRRALGRAFPY